MTPKVAGVMDAVDKERIAVGKALGLTLIPKPEVLKNRESPIIRIIAYMP